MRKQLFIGSLVSAFAVSLAWAAGEKEAAPSSQATQATQATTGQSANAGGSQTPSGAGGSGTAETGRDWSKVDSDGDNSVSAQEMEAWLQANPGPLKK